MNKHHGRARVRVRAVRVFVDTEMEYLECL